MGVRTYRPMTAGQRFKTGYTFEEITKDRPEKSLLVKKKKHSGRNNYGRITTRHQGGGSRRHYRLIDFKRDKHGIPAKVAAIEYDPNRTCRIALLFYKDGEKRYVLAPRDIKVGDTIISGKGVDVRPGNALPLAEIPLGTMIHCVEMKAGKGGQMARSAGNSAQLMAKEEAHAQVRLPSGEVRMVAPRPDPPDDRRHEATCREQRQRAVRRGGAHVGEGRHVTGGEDRRSAHLRQQEHVGDAGPWTPPSFDRACAPLRHRTRPRPRSG